MHCRWARERIRRYVEVGLWPLERAVLRFHLSRCAECFEAYEQAEPVGESQAPARAARPPTRLRVRILSALSVEKLRQQQPGLLWRRRKLQLRNLLAPVAVPASGGLLIALVVVPALLSAFWMEPSAQADDIPLRLLASPIVVQPVLSLPSPTPVGREFTVLALIDARGGVYDYCVVDGDQLDPRARAELASALLTSRFRPARSFGQPVPGHRVILFQRINSTA